MSGHMTPFPIVEMAPEQWQWPMPPFAWRHMPAPNNNVAQPCRIEAAWGATVEGDMVDMDPVAGHLSFRTGAARIGSVVPFERVRRLTLTTPLLPARQPAGTPVERVPAAAQEREYRLEAVNGGEPMTGRTAGHVESDEGLYLFTPTDEERSLQRVFVPRQAYARFEFGPSAEELAAERWIATARELIVALDRQQCMPVLRVGQALLELGMLTQGQLDRALAQQHGDVPLGERLVAAGVISRSDLRTALAYKMGYPFVDLTRFPIDLSAARMLPLRIAAECLALPLMIHGGRLITAVDKPSRTTQLHNLRALVSLKVVPVLATKSHIMMMIADLAQQDIWSHNVLARLMFAPSTV